MIPKTQTAAWLDCPEPGATLRIRHDVPVPIPGSGEILVKVEFTGFCHSDVHSIYGETPMSTHIAGHEGVGRVVRQGPGVESHLLGKMVGLKWIHRACGTCETCQVKVSYCPEQLNHGRNVPGTFQQYVVGHAAYATVIPEMLPPELAAPLLCAGLTMYTSILKIDQNCPQGAFVIIMGAGGGLGHMGVQIAKAKGYRVIAIDSGDKEEVCLQCGAVDFIDFTKENVKERVSAITDGVGAHGIVVTAGSEAAYRQAPELLRNIGVLVCVGLPRSDFHVPISPFQVVVRGLNITGTSVGDEEDMKRLLDMALKGEVLPRVEVFDFKEINRVVGMLARFEVKGRVVLKMP